MNEREALKLALEALELEDMACRYEKDQTPEHITKAITAIKEALAQPERKSLTDEQVIKIIKSNMNMQMDIAGIRQDFEAAYGIQGEA